MCRKLRKTCMFHHQKKWKKKPIRSINLSAKSRLLEETLERRIKPLQWVILMLHAMPQDTVMLRTKLLGNITNLLEKVKVDLILVPEICQNMRLRPIFVHSQNCNRSLVMGQVPLSKPRSITEKLVMLNNTLVKQWKTLPRQHGNVVKVLSRAANATVLCGMVQLLHQMTKSQLTLGKRWENGKLLPKRLMNGNHVLMLTSVEIHLEIRRSNVGVKTSLHTSHGNVLRMVMNASVTEVG